MIDPILPEEVSPPPVLPFESSPPSDPNDMDINDIEDATLEFQSTDETQNGGKMPRMVRSILMDLLHIHRLLLFYLSNHLLIQIQRLLTSMTLKTRLLQIPMQLLMTNKLLLVIPIHLTWALTIISNKFLLPPWITNEILLMIPNHLSNKIRAPKRTHLKVLNLLPSLHRLSLMTSILM